MPTLLVGYCASRKMCGGVKGEKEKKKANTTTHTQNIEDASVLQTAELVTECNEMIIG